MFKMPEEPEAVVRYVLMFLPGFLVLGATTFITERSMSEFAFIYTSVALSIGIYFASAAAITWVRSRKTPSRPIHYREFVGAVSIASVLAVVSLTLSIEKDLVFGTLQAFGINVEKKSTKALLPFYFSHDAGKTAHTLDQRPTSMWSECVTDPKNCGQYRYNIYVRAHIGNDVYEGRVDRYTVGAESNGLPFAMSPACRIQVAGANETASVIPGPGVVIFTEKLESLQLMEMCASACYELINPGGCKKRAKGGARAASQP